MTANCQMSETTDNSPGESDLLDVIERSFG